MGTGASGFLIYLFNKFHNEYNSLIVRWREEPLDIFESIIYMFRKSLALLT
jgi:hypothetical protein